MAISFGPKLNLLYNALIGEQYFDSLRLFLQSIDQLVNGSIINATQVSPPTSPNPGDAYLLIGGTPGGAWLGQAGNIAVWDAQLTQSGTNNVTPGWIFLVPKAGWIVWNTALAGLFTFNGTSWVSIGGGANFPVNTDITSMTGIPNTTINSTGYVIGTPASGTGVAVAQTTISGGVIGSSSSGFELGFNLGSGAGATLLLSDSSGHGATLSATNGLTMNGGLVCGTIETTGNLDFTSGGILNMNNFQNFTPGTPSTFNAQASGTPMQAALIINAVSSTSSTNLLGFTNYPTQTTVGAAGVSVNGTVVLIPCYTI
jgi:Protein of unknown function (DUF2793)